MKKALTKQKLVGQHSELYGDCSRLSGDCTGISGDCSGISRDCSELSGNFDDCEITSEERAKGININDLIKEGVK